MMTALKMFAGATHPSIRSYRHLEAVARIAKAGRPESLGMAYEAVLSLLSDYEATLGLLAANEARQQQQAEQAPLPPRELHPAPPPRGRRVPSVVDNSPEAERHRAAMRQIIKERGLSMDQRPDGLLHIHGRDVDFLVRDLINAHESDLRR